MLFRSLLQHLRNDGRRLVSCHFFNLRILFELYCTCTSSIDCCFRWEVNPTSSPQDLLTFLCILTRTLGTCKICRLYCLYFNLWSLLTVIDYLTHICTIRVVHQQLETHHSPGLSRKDSRNNQLTPQNPFSLNTHYHLADIMEK